MNISKEFSPTWGNSKTTPMRIHPFPATRPMCSGHFTSWNSDMKETE